MQLAGRRMQQRVLSEPASKDNKPSLESIEYGCEDKNHEAARILHVKKIFGIKISANLVSLEVRLNLYWPLQTSGAFQFQF
jgi:hypothetical protein